MLWVGSLRTRIDHISQTNTEPVYYHHIGAPEHIGNTHKPILNITLFCARHKIYTFMDTERVGLSILDTKMY